MEAEEATEAVKPRPERAGHPTVVQRLEDVLIAVSMANLCLISAWFNMLYDADHGYFNKVAVTWVSLAALLTNAAWIGCLFWVALHLRRRHRGVAADLACGVLFALLLLIPLDFCRVMVLHISTRQVAAGFRGATGLLVILAVLGAIFWKPRKAAAAPLVLAGILSPLAVFNIGRVLLLLTGVTHVEQATSSAPFPPLQPVRAGNPRVVWLIFDETDERLAFENRPKGLQLPAFDRLRGESLVATNAYSPADSTLVSMPSLILGRHFTAADPESPSELELTAADAKQVYHWGEEWSVFDAARKLGYNTALVGWYHPYARVLKRALNECVWFPMQNFEPARAPTFKGAIARELAAMQGGFHLRQLYVDLCLNSVTNSLEMITNGTYGLVLLHLPMPHLPGVYVPEENRFTSLGTPGVRGYFNNLVFADKWLGQLLRALENSSCSTNTWLILSADHSWRESRLYDGVRDHRVPFIIKTPLEHDGQTYIPEFNTVLTRELILSILGKGITTQRGAALWLDAHRGSSADAASPHATAQPNPEGRHGE